MQGNENSQNSLPEIKKTFERGERYDLDGVDGVRLFSKEDIDYDQYNTLMKNPLNAEIDIMFNDKFKTGYSMLQAIKDNLIKLDLQAIIYLWKLKMCNPLGKHYVKYLTAMGLPNLKPYPHKLRDGGEIMEYNYEIPQLSPQMDKFQQCFALLYTGYVLIRLLTEKPTSFVKNKYEIQESLKPKISRDKPNKNDSTYFLEYETPFQFAIFPDTKHNIVIFTSFHISRTKLKVGNFNVTETKATLATCFPEGNQKKIRCALWAEDSTKKVLNSEYEKKKFESVVRQFKADSFLNALKLITPDFETNTTKKNEIRAILRFLNFDDGIINDILVGIIRYPIV